MKNAVLSIVPQRYIDRIEASPLAYRLAHGTFWSLAGAIASRGSMLFASIIVARLLGKEGFGEFGIIQSTFVMFSVFAGFGMGLTASKHVAEFRISDPTRAGRIVSLSLLVSLVTGILLTIILVLYAPWLAANALAAPQLTGLLQIGAVVLILGAVNEAQNGTLTGLEAFKVVAKINLVSGVLSFILMIIGAYLGGLKGAVFGLVISTAITCIINHIALKSVLNDVGLQLNYLSSLIEWPVLWTFGVPAVLAGTMVGPINWFCNSMLVNQPGGYSEMGLFFAANQWFSALLFLPTILGQAILPIFSERIGNKDNANSGKLLVVSIKLNAFIVLPIVIIGSLISPFIMGLYGEAYKNAWPTLVAVFLTAGILAIQTPVGQIIAASGKMWTGFIMNMGWGLAFIGVTWLLVDRGALGLAAARGIAYLLHAIWTLGFAYLIISKSGRLK